MKKKTIYNDMGLTSYRPKKSDFKHKKDGEPSDFVLMHIHESIAAMERCYDTSNEPKDVTIRWMVRHIGRLHGELAIVKAYLKLPNW